MLTRRALGLLPAIVATACGGGPASTATPTASPVPAASVDSLLAEPPFDRVHWGVLAVELETGRMVYERNAELLFIPASNQKIPVTAAALGLLGPEYRWEATFYSRARPVNGVLPGDLYLVGDGDPTLGRPFFDPPESALRELADSLRAAGVREVEGRLVLDAAAWDSTTVPESWMMEDLNGRYGATGGAFAVRTGELEVEVRGGDRAGEPAVVDWVPRGGELPGGEPFVVHEVMTVAATGSGAPEPELRLEFRPESRQWLLTGEIEVGDIRSFTRSSRDPVRLGLSALAGALEDREIRLGEGTEILWDPGLAVETRCASGRIPRCAEMLRIAGMASPPLGDVVSAILGPSQNWMAEQLVRTLGAELGEEGSWNEGFEAMLGFLESEVGVGPEDVHFEDGSGLSAQNLVSPRALVRMLRYAEGRPWGDLFREGMARPGVEDTTLESRLETLAGRVWAKTGTISHVNSLSGYLRADDGSMLVFSVLSNGADLSASEVRGRIDAVVEALARSGTR